MTDNVEIRQPAADPNEPVVDQRRDALKKLGRFAAVTLRPSRCRSKPAGAIPSRQIPSGRRLKTPGEAPYAEDFKAAFGVDDGVTISTTDAIGVCLAAIKALAGQVDMLEAELQSTRRSSAG